MPKKIVIKFKEEKMAKDVVEETSQVEPEVSTAEIETKIQAKPPESIAAPKDLEASIVKEAFEGYDALMAKLQEIKIREQIFQKMLLEQDISIATIKEILSRWNAMREQVIGESASLIEKINAAKSKLETEFSNIETDLYISVVELDTLKYKESSNIPVPQELKAGLETKITILRQELSEKKKKIKELEEMVKTVTELPKKIHSLTTYTELADKLYEELKEKHGAKFGPRVDESLQKNIENIMQSLGIPREYAIILIWKEAQASAS
jgi:DNA-binding transcriptional MerR regulator